MKTFQAKSILAAALAAVLALFLILAPAQAHDVTPTSASPADQAVLPQAPFQVYLTFPEEIAENGSTLQVFDQQGRQVDLGKGGVDLNDPNHAALVVKLPVSLTPGAYLVRWKVALLDGDSSSGAYYFGVGNMTLPADPPAGAALAPASRVSGAASRASGTGIPSWPIAGAALVAVAAIIFAIRRRFVK